MKASEKQVGSGEVADQYLRRMSFAFSSDGWSQPAQEVFQRQLRGVQGVIHGRSSNLYGIMDLTENFEYQGALALTVKQLDGSQPALYVNDLVHGQKVFSGREAVVLESLSRYRNPDFIRAMKSEGYDGARYLSRIVDNQYGWNVVSDVITADDWKQSAEIYLDDKYQLGLREFFNQHNPHALQNIASRVLETHRKGLQKLDTKTLELAARVYVETVAEHGAACASHICGNPELSHARRESRRRIEPACGRHPGEVPKPNEPHRKRRDGQGPRVCRGLRAAGTVPAGGRRSGLDSCPARLVTFRRRPESPDLAAVKLRASGVFHDGGLAVGASGRRTQHSPTGHASRRCTVPGGVHFRHAVVRHASARSRMRELR